VDPASPCQNRGDPLRQREPRLDRAHRHAEPWKQRGPRDE
jgi:hypothetical protein